MEESETEEGHVRLVGIGLDVLKDVASREVSRVQFEQFMVVIETIMELSQTHNAAFSVQYGVEEIGSVSDGQPNFSVRQGLIEPWKREIEGE